MGNILRGCCESEEGNLTSRREQFLRAAPALLAQQATSSPNSSTNSNSDAEKKYQEQHTISEIFTFLTHFLQAAVEMLHIPHSEAIKLTGDIIENDSLCNAATLLRTAWNLILENNNNKNSNNNKNNNNLFVKTSQISILKMWLDYDCDGSGDLNKLELENMLQAMNFDNQLGKKLLSEVKKLKTDSRVRFADFVRIYKKIVECSEFIEYWESAKEAAVAQMTIKSKNNSNSNTNNLVRTATPEPQQDDIMLQFLLTSQKHPDVESAKKELAEIRRRLCGGSIETVHDFLDVITDRELNCVLDTAKISSVYQDMTQPMCDYFISSSHNTYLTGDQLQSNSDIKMYTKALRDGCRCVELDCWDVTTQSVGKYGKNMCVVYHGFTRTSKIGFEEVIQAIAADAFTSSEYPVTLSLELHVSVETQQQMVELMKFYFGNELAIPSWKQGEAPPRGFVFSPEAFKRKIIIKAKRVSADGEGGGDEDDDADERDDDDCVAEIEAEKEKHRQEAAAGDNHKDNNNNNNNNAPDSASRSIASTNSSKKAKKTKMFQGLSDIVLMESKSFKAFDKSSHLAPHQVCSLGEFKAKRMSGSMSASDPDMAAFIRHNAHCLSRIYPGGFRIDSSNFSPQQFWNAGCQLVAMNWQSSSSSELRLYKGRFIDNGGSGYLLKPEWMRNSKNFSLGATTNGTRDENSFITPAENKKLRVTIISAMAIPKPMNSQRGEIVDPYCYCFLEGPGVPASTGMSTTLAALPGMTNNAVLKTSVIQDNGFHPVWANKKKKKNFLKKKLTSLFSGNSTNDKNEQNAQPQQQGENNSNNHIDNAENVAEDEEDGLYCNEEEPEEGQLDSSPSLNNNINNTTASSNPKQGVTSSNTKVFNIPYVEMTTLCLQVFDQDLEGDEILCEAFLPVHLIRQGLRCVPMWSKNHKVLASTFAMAEFEFIDEL